MTINTLPAAPTRSMSAPDFVTAANAFLAALPTFSTQVNADLSALLTLSQLVSTSTTSLLIGTGSKSLTVQTAKAYLAGQMVRIYSTATPDNYMDGTVTSYDAGTGALVVNVTSVGGSGTLAAWTVILNNGLGLTNATLAQFASTTSAQLAGVISDETGSGALVFANSPSLVTPSVSAPSAAAHATRWDTPNMASITVTQAGGALTFAGIAHPLTFRSATLTDGSVSTIIADPADLVLPSGGTLGFVTTVQGRIVVAEMNNGGVSEYAICNIAGGLQMDETNLISTTAIDTASDAANVWYSTTARTNLPYKIVCEVDVVNTAGAWGNPVLVQPAGGQAVRAGRNIVQIATTHVGTVATGTTIVPFDNTIPQNTEGDQYMSLSITPTDANNLLEIDVTWIGSSSIAGPIAMSLFMDSVASALDSAVSYQGGATGMVELTIKYTMLAGSTSPITFKVRAGGYAAGTTTFNGSAASQIFGGVLASHITIKEYAQ